MKYKFSVSEIISAHKCPMHFYLKRIGKNVYFSFKESNHIGTFVHKVLSDFAISVKTVKLFEDKNKDLIEKALYESFQKASFASKNRTINYEKAWRYIESAGAYFQSFALGKTREEIQSIFLLSEKPFRIHMNNTIISGKFDLMMNVNGNIRIIDYKTRGSDIETDGIQIALYKFAVEQLYGIKVDPAVVYIEDGSIKEEKFTEKEFKEIMSEVKAIVKDMISYLKREKVPFITADKEVCKHCNLNYNCEKIVEEVF